MTVHRTAADARLEGERSTAVFRILLDTLARPGLIRVLPAGLLPFSVPPALVLPLALADLGTGFSVVGGDEASAAWCRDIVRLATDALHTDPYGADLAVLLAADPAALAALRGGTEEAPEVAVKLAVQVEDLHSGAVARLDGPGVPAPLETTTGVPAAFLEALAARNAAPPSGIDTWIVDRAGRVLGLARTTRVQPVGGERGEVR